MYSFTEDWAQEVADISGDSEYQNAQVEIRNPALVTRTYNEANNTFTETGNPVVWSGQARFIGVRTSVAQAAGNDKNPTSIQSGRLQIPYGAYPGRINRGWQVRIVSCPRNQAIEDVLFTVNNDVQGSSAASRTLELAIDVESSAGWQ